MDGDVACGLGPLQRRVKRHRVGPDGAEPILHRPIGKIVQADVAKLRVRKGAVVAALPREVSIDVDAPADVADEDERRPVVVRFQPVGVVPRLIEGVLHQHVPRRGAELGLILLGGEQFGLAGDGLVLAGEARLFGLQHEGVLFVEVDAQGLGLVAAHRMLKAIGGAAGLRAGRIGAGEAEGVAQFAEEHLIVGAFGAAGQVAPSLDEIVDGQAAAPSRRTWPGSRGGGKRRVVRPCPLHHPSDGPPPP